MLIKIEHVNLHVRQVQTAIDFLLCAFPEFTVRFDSGADDPERWVHVGSEDYYLALSLANEAGKESRVLYSSTPGYNHLGFVVDDLEALRARLLLAGYEESTISNYHPARKRAYFFDAERNDWEFVEYLTKHKAEQNDYVL